MGMYRKILVAFDGSDSSLNALLQAFKLANDEKCWITVATVVPSYEGDLDLIAVKNVHQSVMHSGEDILAKAEELAKGEGASIKTELLEGPVYEKLVHLAEDENYSIIIMGSRGKTRIERALVGSVTARVIGHTTKDVLVVPEDTSIKWRNTVLATDGSKYCEDATTKAIEFAKSYGEELKILSVVDVPDEFYAEAPKVAEEMARKANALVNNVKKQAESCKVNASAHVGEGDAYKVITDFAKKENSDVIIMGSHGRTGLKKILMGSVTEKVIGHAPCPVLIAR